MPECTCTRYKFCCMQREISCAHCCFKWLKNASYTWATLFFVLTESVAMELIRQMYLCEFENKNIKIKTIIEILVNKFRKVATGWRSTSVFAKETNFRRNTPRKSLLRRNEEYIIKDVKWRRTEMETLYTNVKAVVFVSLLKQNKCQFYFLINGNCRQWRQLRREDLVFKEWMWRKVHRSGHQHARHSGISANNVTLPLSLEWLLSL
jgi:hypothetical protein